MMQNKKSIVITGSIGTGKSTAVNILKKLGFTVLDSDKIVHDGYNKGSELYIDVLKHFGEGILNENKTINRQKLGRIVFNNKEELEKLNSITHAYVLKKLMESAQESNDEVIFFDIPLILESLVQNKKYELTFDEIWLIYVRPQTQINRLTKRAVNENKCVEEVLNIINKQIPIDDKVSMVDEVIDNEGTIEELELKIKELLQKKHIGW